MREPISQRGAQQATHPRGRFFYKPVREDKLLNVPRAETLSSVQIKTRTLTLVSQAPQMGAVEEAAK